jgi:hypothetical protein
MIPHPSACDWRRQQPNWDADGNADGVVPVGLSNLSVAALGVFGMIRVLLSVVYAEARMLLGLVVLRRNTRNSCADSLAPP